MTFLYTPGKTYRHAIIEDYGTAYALQVHSLGYKQFIFKPPHHNADTFATHKAKDQHFKTGRTDTFPYCVSLNCYGLWYTEWATSLEAFLQCLAECKA